MKEGLIFLPFVLAPILSLARATRFFLLRKITRSHEKTRYIFSGQNRSTTFYSTDVDFAVI